MNASAHTPNPWAKVIAAILGGSLIVSIVVLAFVWPTKTVEIHNIPLSLAGPEVSTSALESMLDTKEPGMFDIVNASSRDDAMTQVMHRETYGAIVLGGPGEASEVIIASGASPMVANALTGFAAQLQGALAGQVAAAGGDPSTVSVTTTNAAPLSDSDPTGSGLAAASFPLTLGGLIGGMLASFLVTGFARRATVVVGFAAVAGVALSGILGSWFGFLEADFWTNALAIGASILATSSLIAGGFALLGRAGLGLTAAFTMLVANPLASAALPWQFIAEPWGEFGQYLVPGASAWLIRTVNYFPDADVSMQWTTLAVWAACGLALLAVGGLRSQKDSSN